MAELEATVPELTELAEGLHRSPVQAVLASCAAAIPVPAQQQASDLTLAQLSILVTLLDRARSG